MKKNLTLLITLFIVNNLFSQLFADKEYYLIDSLVLEDLSTYDKTLLDTSLQMYHNSNTDTAKLKGLLYFVESSWNIELWPLYNNIIYKQSVQLLESTKNEKIRNKLIYFKGYGLSTKASYFLATGVSDSSFFYLNKALEVLKGTTFEKEISGIYALFTVHYNNIGNTIKALEYTKKNIQLSEKINDIQGLSYAYSALGNLYTDQKDYQNSLKMFTIACHYCTLNNDSRLLGVNLIDKGQVFLILNELDSSLYYLEKGEKEALKVSDYYGILTAKKTKAKIFLKKNDLKKAKEILKEVVIISKKKKSKTILSFALKDLAKIALRNNQLKEAEEYALEAYTLSKKINRLESKTKSTNILFQVYEKQKKHDLALQFLKEYVELKDKLYNKNNKKSTLQFEVDLEYEKQKEIDDLKNKQKIELAETQKQKSKIAMIASVVIASIIGLFSIFIFSRLKIINKQKTDLDTAYEKLEETKKYELALSNLKAIRSQMNPHFIFNSLNSIQDLVLQQDTDKSYDYIVLFADLVRSSLNYSEKEFITIDKELDFLKVYLKLEKLRFGDELKYEVIYNEALDVKIPSLVVQPFIENALLHGLLNKKGTKEISITFEMKDQMVCTIIDNGIGRKRAQELKARQGGSHSSFSTNAIKKRMQILSDQYKMEASFEYEDLIENKEVKGTKVVIVLPFKKF